MGLNSPLAILVRLKYVSFPKIIGWDAKEEL
jgi:hypothetical protein